MNNSERRRSGKATIVFLALALSMIISFHIQPAHAVSWSSPVQVPINTGFNIKPSLAQDSKSNFWLVYESALTQQAYFKIYNGFTWTAESNFTNSRGPNGYWINEAPAISTLSNGTLFLAWDSNRTVNAEVFYKTNTKNIWSPETQLTSTPNQDQDPSIAQDSSGRIWVVWDRFFTSTANLYYNVYTPGVGWSGETALTTGTQVDTSPSVTVTTDGRVLVAWSSSRTGTYQLWYKYYNGSSWTADTRLTNYAQADSDPSIVQTRDGNIWVVWSRTIKISNFLDGTDIYYVNSTSSGSTWSTPTAITTNGSSATGCQTDPCLNGQPSAIQSSDKRLYIFFSSNTPDTSDFHIFYLSSPQILIHDLAVTALTVTPSKLYPGGLKSINQSAMVAINSTITNLGDFSDNAQYTLYANSTLLASVPLGLLLPTQAVIVVSAWNTTGYHTGCYQIKAVVAIVPGEANTVNNSLIVHNIRLLQPGDINQDGVINLLDASVLAAAYGSRVGSSKYVAAADINSNGVIDLGDASVLALHYGWRCLSC